MFECLDFGSRWRSKEVAVEKIEMLTRQGELFFFLTNFQKTEHKM